MGSQTTKSRVTIVVSPEENNLSANAFGLPAEIHKVQRHEQAEKMAQNCIQESTSSVTDTVSEETNISETELEHTTQAKVNVDEMNDEQMKAHTDKVVNTLVNIAKGVMALAQKRTEDGIYSGKIISALYKFHEALFALEGKNLTAINVYRTEVSSVLINTKMAELAAEIVIETYPIIKRNDFGEEERCIHILKQIDLALTTAQNFTDVSSKVASFFANASGFLETIKTILEDIKVATSTSNDLQTMSYFNMIKEQLLEGCLGTVHNISMRETNVQRLNDLKFTSILPAFLSESNKTRCVLALTSLAVLINEKECSIINTNINIVKYVLHVLQRAIKNDHRSFDGWSSSECAFIVRQLAKNDANKKMLGEMGAFNLLVELARIGDTQEKHESVDAIWTLCFDKSNREKVVKNQEIGVVDLLLELKKTNDKELKRQCSGALWTLREELKLSTINAYSAIGTQLDPPRKSEQSDDGKPHLIGHVMISYQWANQEILKLIRDRIKTKGYKVWMDIDEMGGSTYQAMAEAVENATVVLICLSRQYKDSSNCRAEAEYAFQTKKNIIPLKMEQGYNPDGWLGLICSAKMFYEFSGKYPFETKLAELIRAIEKLYNISRTHNGLTGNDVADGQMMRASIPEEASHVVPYVESRVDTAAPVGKKEYMLQSNISIAIERVRKWSNNDVQDWIDQSDLKGCSLAKMNGGEVATLIRIWSSAPEYFYNKCLESVFKIKDFRTISKIDLALSDLSQRY